MAVAQVNRVTVPIQCLRIRDSPRITAVPLHAPRQTGKTSALLALAEVLNERGYGCVYVGEDPGVLARRPRLGFPAVP